MNIRLQTELSSLCENLPRNLNDKDLILQIVQPCNSKIHISISKYNKFDKKNVGILSKIKYAFCNYFYLILQNKRMVRVTMILAKISNKKKFCNCLQQFDIKLKLLKFIEIANSSSF